MGKFKDETGKTKVGMFLKKFAPNIIDVVGDVLPSSGALGIVKNLIDKDDKLTAEQKAEALELLKIDLQNTKDARELQKIALQQDDLFSKRFIYYLAIFWSVVCSIYFFLATFTQVINEEMADIILGFLLGTVSGTVINFFFGSSQGSKEKDRR